MKNIAVKCDQRLSHSFTSLLSTADQMMSNGLNGCTASVPSPVGLTTTTTQTTLSSLALPPLPRPLSTHTPQLTVISQPLNIGQTARTTTPAVRTVGSETKPTRNKHLVVNRTNGLYEGSHIHFSPVDNKPLCSYSTKLCKQRRINGYAFCIRHILEDPSAPFRQCKHVAKYNQQKCSNAIPANEERLFCNSHMQIAGMAPKKERKEKSKEKNTNGSGQNNTSATTATNINSISQTSCGNKTVNGFKVNTKDVNQLTDHKLTNFEAFIKPPIKLNGSKSVVNANTLQKLNNNLQKKSLTIDKSCGTTAPLLLHSVAIETSDSSHMNSAFKVNSNLNKTKSTDTQKNATAVVKPKPKRKKKDKKSSIDKFVLARKKSKGDGLFNYHIWSETDESDAEIDDECRKTSGHQSSGASAQELCPLIAGSLSANIVDLEPNELKNELLSQKWLLKNLIDIRKRDFQPHLDKTRSILKTLNCSPMKSFSYLDYKLAESGRRSEQSIRKGICCYSSDESRCRRPSLPMSRHCSEHILYNVDQCLFSRCTAKCAQTMTQCSRPTFDIVNEEPLCTHHLLFGTEVDERTVSPTSDKNRKRRKTKPMALTRVSRRGKKGAKKRKGPNGTEITVIEDSIESRLSIDDDSHSHSSTNDITINLLAQKPDHNQNHSSDHIITDHVNVNVNINAINTSIPQTTSSAAIVSSAVLNIAARPQNRPHDIPLMRLSPMMTTSCAQPPVTTCVPVMPMVSSGVPLVSAGCQPGVPIVTSVMDHSMPPPPPLEPTEEALVASIVADLPQLTTDADFTEVLNKIPDDFSDFLLEHPNGEMPTTEETEALEQALAMVNKDVQNLVAGINGSGDSFGDFGSWLGGLTPDQRQQLNGLIDGAIASNSLSPILKNACDAYPSIGSALPSSAPPILKTQSYMTAVHSSQANPYPNLHSYPNLVPVQPQEFVPISAPVPTLINNNLLINGLSSHPS